jgi:hypothetical protein
VDVHQAGKQGKGFGNCGVIQWLKVYSGRSKTDLPKYKKVPRERDFYNLQRI